MACGEPRGVGKCLRFFFLGKECRCCPNKNGNIAQKINEKMEKILMAVVLAALLCIALYAQNFGGKVVETQKLFGTKIKIILDLVKKKEIIFYVTIE